MHPEGASSFVKVLETDSLADIALIKSVLDSEGIEFYMQGENMRFIQPFDPVVLFVTDVDVERVVCLLKPLKLAYASINWG